MKQRKVVIYCKCEVCLAYFDVTGIKRSRFCSRSCRDKDFYKHNQKAKLKTIVKPI